VQVYAGADGAFTLVEDDGETEAYRTQGGVRTTRLSWDDAAATLSWVAIGPAGGAQSFSQLYVKYYGTGKVVTSKVASIGDKGQIKVAVGTTRDEVAL
jgi:alpha-D-xyloside xylohydrolase